MVRSKCCRQKERWVELAGMATGWGGDGLCRGAGRGRSVKGREVVMARPERIRHASGYRKKDGK